MKVLITQHIHDVSNADDVHTTQKVVDTNHTSIVDFFIEYNQIEEGSAWVPDKWTTVNEFGLFVTCPVCAESYVILDRPITEDVTLTGEECRQLRWRLHLSQRQLADRANVSLSTIARFEVDPHRTLQQRILRKLVTVLKANV